MSGSCAIVRSEAPLVSPGLSKHQGMLDPSSEALMPCAPLLSQAGDTEHRLQETNLGPYLIIILTDTGTQGAVLT